jgi:hypothetical protein
MSKFTVQTDNFGCPYVRHANAEYRQHPRGDLTKTTLRLNRDGTQTPERKRVKNAGILAALVYAQRAREVAQPSS